MKMIYDGDTIVSPIVAEVVIETPEIKPARVYTSKDPLERIIPDKYGAFAMITRYTVAVLALLFTAGVLGESVRYDEVIKSLLFLTLAGAGIAYCLQLLDCD